MRIRDRKMRGQYLERKGDGNRADCFTGLEGREGWGR